MSEFNFDLKAENTFYDEPKPKKKTKLIEKIEEPIFDEPKEHNPVNVQALPRTLMTVGEDRLINMLKNPSKEDVDLVLDNFAFHKMSNEQAMKLFSKLPFDGMIDECKRRYIKNSKIAKATLGALQKAETN